MDWKTTKQIEASRERAAKAVDSLRTLLVAHITEKGADFGEQASRWKEGDEGVEVEEWIERLKHADNVLDEAYDILTSVHGIPTTPKDC